MHEALCTLQIGNSKGPYIPHPPGDMKVRPTGVTSDVCNNVELMPIGFLQEEYDVKCNGYAAVFLTRLRQIRLCPEYNSTHCSPKCKLTPEDFRAKFQEKNKDFSEVISANLFMQLCDVKGIRSALGMLRVRTASDPKAKGKHIREVYEQHGFYRDGRQEIQINAQAHLARACACAQPALEIGCGAALQ